MNTDEYLAALEARASKSTHNLYSRVIADAVTSIGPESSWSLKKVTKWLEELKKRGWKDSSRSTALAVMRACCRQCRPDLVTPGSIESLPSRIKFKKEPPRAATPEELAQVLSYSRMRKSLRLGLLLMADAGLRECEVRGLTWNDVDLEKETLTVFGKGSKTRTLPIFTARLKEELLAQRREEGYVIPGRDGAMQSREGLSKRIGTLTERVLGRRISAHGFRHCFAVRGVTSGVSVKFIQSALGHSTLAVTSRYLEGLEGNVDALRDGYAGFS